jgi:hypothetical protein
MDRMTKSGMQGATDRCRIIRDVEEKIVKKEKPPEISEGFCGLDGTRTRDLRRDRAAF